jgi:hypothetical protein
MPYNTIDDVRGDERIDSRDLIELRAALADERDEIEPLSSVS